MTTPEEKILKQGMSLMGEIITQDVADKGARMIKELLKHAQDDECLSCIEVLTGMGINYTKSYEQLVREAKAMYPKI